jgi:hypothetical protein
LKGSRNCLTPPSLEERQTNKRPSVCSVPSSLQSSTILWPASQPASSTVHLSDIRASSPSSRHTANKEELSIFLLSLRHTLPQPIRLFVTATFFLYFHFTAYILTLSRVPQGEQRRCPARGLGVLEKGTRGIRSSARKQKGRGDITKVPRFIVTWQHARFWEITLATTRHS